MIVLNLTLAGQIFSYFKENGISYIDFPKIYEITKNNKTVNDILHDNLIKECFEIYLSPWRDEYKKIILNEEEIEHLRKMRKKTPDYLKEIFLEYKHSFSNSVTAKEFALLFLATLAQTRRETTGLVPFPQTYLGDIDELFLSKNDSYYSRFLDLSKLKEKDKTKAIDEFLINLENEIENILIELRKNFIVRDNDVKLDLHKVWASKVLQEYDMETINRMNSLLNECFGIIQTKQPQEKGFQRKKLYKIKKK